MSYALLVGLCPGWRSRLHGEAACAGAALCAARSGQFPSRPGDSRGSGDPVVSRGNSLLLRFAMLYAAQAQHVPRSAWHAADLLCALLCRRYNITGRYGSQGGQPPGIVRINQASKKGQHSLLSSPAAPHCDGPRPGLLGAHQPAGEPASQPAASHPCLPALICCAWHQQDPNHKSLKPACPSLRCRASTWPPMPSSSEPWAITMQPRSWESWPCPR